MLMDYNQALRQKTIGPRKTLVKKGTLDIGIVETTPVVWKERLYRFEWIRDNAGGAGYWNNQEGTAYFRFTDMETEESTPAFGHGYAFGSAYVDSEGGKAYAFGVHGGGGGHRLDVFWSSDMERWESAVALDFPTEWQLYNTSVCKGRGEYILAVEIGGPKEVGGEGFTVVFAKSPDLIHWELMPAADHIYTRERYSACPVIRYAAGGYYMIYLESMPCHRWMPYIVRTKDFVHFELGLRNPVMCFDDGDKKIQRPEKYTEEQIAYILNSIDCNNSDVDICEFQGKTVILYSWGNQYGKEFLAQAEYDGSMEEFLISFFE